MSTEQTTNLLVAAADPLAPADPGSGGAVGNALEAVESPVRAVSESFTQAFNTIIDIAPNVVAAVVILVLGYLAAKLLARAATALSETIGLQTAAERSGLADSMKKVNIQRSVPAIIGMIVFWLMMAVAFMAAFNVLELTALSVVMLTVVAYIPKLLVATVVLVIGLLVANFLSGLVATSAERLGITYAQHLATACYFVFALVTVLAAAQHLELKVPLLQEIVLITFAGLSLGFALALGLGGRDVLGGILSGYYIRQRFQAGDHVAVAGMEGTVREVGPVATVIETEDEGLLHRHSVPNAVMLKEGVR